MFDNDPEFFFDMNKEIIVDSVKMMKLKPFCKVVLNGDEYIINNDLIYKYKIQKGTTFSELEFSIIIDENQLMNAKRKAYEYVTYSPRSENKVRQKLNNEKYKDEIIEKTIEFLYEFELLNDEDFTRKYIHDYLLKKKSGRFNLIKKLIENGIDPALAKNAVFDVVSDEMEKNMINEILTNDFSFQIDDKAKIVRKLLNRGYHMDNIKKCVFNDLKYQ